MYAIYSGRGATFRDSDICTQTRRRSSEYNLDIDCAHALAFTIVSLATPLIGQIDDMPRHCRLSMTTCRFQTPRRRAEGTHALDSLPQVRQ
jgi:hypothetical protein